MKLSSIVSFFLVFSSCALTPPEGVKQLYQAIEDDRERSIEAEELDQFREVHLGRPLFIKVRFYKRIKGGNVYDSHWIFLQVGREKLSIEDLIGDQL